MTPLIASPFVPALASTLVHVLWQGAALGAVVFLWLRVWRPTAQARYAGGIVALAALLAAPVATFVWLATAASDTQPETIVLAPAPSPGVDVAADRVPPRLPAAPGLEAPGSQATAGDLAAAAIVTAWGLCVVLLSMRLAGGWILARGLSVRGARPAAADLRAAVGLISRRLGLTRAVRVVESTAVTVPMLVGWLRPVVLFPASALSGLSAAQVEALIAHELAHVRRHDYVVNILQSLVETLLFYHPVVWFVSGEVREAREQCCDDLAVGVCDRVVYASALADLAALSGTPRIALAATDGSLLRRVRRILGRAGEDCGPGVTWLGVLSLAFVTGAVMPAAFGPAALDPSPVQGVPAGMADGTSAESTATGGGSVVDGIDAGNVDGVVRGVRDEEGEALSGDGSAGAPRGVPSARVSGTRQRQHDRRPERPMSTADVRDLEARIEAVEQRVAAALAERAGGGTADDLMAESAARLAATLARARAELDVARADYERRQQDFAIGRLSSSDVRAAQERLAAAERELAFAAFALQTNAEEATVRHTLEASRARVQAESRIKQAEIELQAARQSVDTIRLRFDGGRAGPDALAEADRRAAAATERLETARAELALVQEEIAMRQMRADALRRLVSEGHEQNLWPRDERTSIVTDVAAQVQPGDVLSIEIAGEPDLPRTYRVGEDGMIRLPLLGTVRVAGLTTRQVRQAVTEALKQRQLGEGRSVTVALRRPQ